MLLFSMEKIVKITDKKNLANKKALREVQAIMRAQFPGLETEKIDNLPFVVFGRPRKSYSYSLWIAADERENILGFINYSFFSRDNFYFLDHLATAPGLTGKGIGGRLYEFLRAKAREAEAVGIFFECLNDNPAGEKNAGLLKQNQARLKFYERYGARPIANNRYEEKVHPDNNSTLLVFDPLDAAINLDRYHIRKIVRKIVLKKYSDFCPPDYIKRIVNSFVDPLVTLRPPLYPGDQNRK
ncbi:hypothetical protein COX69_04195 [Candidatus Falkowbacteria bacterium CG_4_10_14_0_2_um_filter_48_10]|uniref:N-acetyltransferase domain-containing protein n=1 Tax=Candidatus Falkowbacteria bacterium CG23_combo_of_CG06-09_8_20_14_all_49_15 TaxID=1974572 RepID=A0A2G9ZKZ6_9BACT|nr:MAG: hypothetical protein COX22_02270 [Candidatus Falkowbacteria bacterium CG23_combo_of_CG06-09_8_20_14_all_49_15]PJA07622.1 MAG: hypothetical protein COX69_04195 [Candidatus Falkowbacteria bacterium CG_4_10_14_0_2_um_filter_48_10]